MAEREHIVLDQEMIELRVVVRRIQPDAVYIRSNFVNGCRDAEVTVLDNGLQFIPAYTPISKLSSCNRIKIKREINFFNSKAIKQSGSYNFAGASIG